MKGLKILNPIAGIAGGISETVKNAKIVNNVGNGITPFILIHIKEKR